MPSTDTYIAKDSSVNDEIDKMRHSATAALIERKDVIVVSSVSCIYGIGDPEDSNSMRLLRFSIQEMMRIFPAAVSGLREMLLMFFRCPHLRQE